MSLGRLPELTVDELRELEHALVGRVDYLDRVRAAAKEVGAGAAVIGDLEERMRVCFSLRTAVVEARYTAERTEGG